MIRKRQGEPLVGRVYPPTAHFLRKSFGSAYSENGNEYKLGVVVKKGQMLVKSEKTGKWFVLTWPDVVRLAVDAGIDDEGGY